MSETNKPQFTAEEIKERENSVSHEILGNSVTTDMDKIGLKILPEINKLKQLVHESDTSELSILIFRLSQNLEEIANEGNFCASFVNEWIEDNIGTLMTTFNDNYDANKFKVIGDILLAVTNSWPSNLDVHSKKIKIAQVRHAVLEFFPYD